MGLFDKSKGASQTPDISEIKQEASPTQPSSPSQSEQFVNPFSNSSQPQQQSDAFSSQQGSSSQLPSFDSSQSQQPQMGMSQSQMPSFDSPMNQQSSGNQFTNLNSGQDSPMSINSSMESIVQPQMGGNQEEMQALINETIEKIIEEKWVELTDNVQRVVDWKSKVEDQITLIKEDVVAMQEGFSTLEKRLISKLNNYDKSILDVGSEIKALDKVFQKITPTLVNNVTELGRIAKDLKGISHNKKE